MKAHPTTSSSTALSDSPNRRSIRAALLIVLALLLQLSTAWAQQPAAPGEFDFYLLNLSWSPEFCYIHDTSPECASRPGFVVHGLWPQNNDGSYPVSCSQRPGPSNPQANLDMTPDISLLQHEWEKHGTCTTLSPDRYFAEERQAFHSVQIPKFFANLNHQALLTPEEIRKLFAEANPSFPEGSIVVSCGHNYLTAIEACFSKDGLKSIACQGLRECQANVVRIEPPGRTHSLNTGRTRSRFTKEDH